MTRGNEHCTRTVTKLQRTLDTGQWTLGQSLKIVWKVEVYMRKYVVAVWQWHGWRWIFDPTSRGGQSCRKFSALNCPSPSEINQSNSISFGNYQVNLFGALPTRRSGFLENPTFLRSYLQVWTFAVSSRILGSKDWVYVYLYGRRGSGLWLER